MQRFIGLFVCVLAALGALSSTSFAAAPARLIQTQDQRKAIADQYIVVLKDGPSINAGSVAQSIGVSPKFTYSAAINGFAAKLTPRQLKQLQQHPQVDYIEQDAEISAQVEQPQVSLKTTQTSATWGIDRIDQPNLPLNGTYVYNTTASNVTAYVIDTGIANSHVQFSGRAASAYDALGGNGVDCHGFGTHLAGTIGSMSYGVAKGVRLRGVRVFDCFRSGTISSVLAGIKWVTDNAVKPSVAIFGSWTSYNATLNNAASNLANAGVYVALPAGDSGVDACTYSPGSTVALMTVGASNNTDTRPSWSNYGNCVDLHAPGVSILSTWINGGTNTISSTAMAAAHVTGCAAKYKATYGDVPQSTLNQWLTSNATVVNGIRIMYCPL